MKPIFPIVLTSLVLAGAIGCSSTPDETYYEEEYSTKSTSAPAVADTEYTASDDLGASSSGLGN